MKDYRPSYNADLDKEFQQLGFMRYREMLEKGLFFEKWMMLSTKETVMRAPGNGTQAIRYSFIVDHGKNDKRSDGIAKISMIAATLQKTVLLNGLRLTLDSDEMMFGIEKAPLPTKTQIEDIMATRISQFQQIKKVVEIFNMGLRSEEYKEWEKLRTPVAKHK